MSSVSQEERTGAFVTYLLTAFLGIIGAVIGWAIFKDKGTFAKQQTTEAMNWAITLLIVLIPLYILIGVLANMLGSLAGILGLLPMLIGLASLVLCILAAIKANGGESYRFPFAFRFIK
jgi:uncharacterized protein